MVVIASVVVGVVRFVVKNLSPSPGRIICHWRHLKRNFQNLKTEVEKLKAKSRSIQRYVDAAKRNGDGIEENVQIWLERGVELQLNFQKWMERASKFIGDDQAKRRKAATTAVAAAEEIGEGEETAAVEEIGEGEETAAAGEIGGDEEKMAVKNRCFNRLCTDLKARYQLGKEAVTLLQAVVKHLEAGKLDKVSYPVILRDPWLSNKDYIPFESRTSTLMNVIRSLREPDVNIVGIYGAGGVGKTMLAKEVAKQTKANKVFDSVVFVEVTKKPHIIKIQSQIAEKLGLPLSQEESESTRAGKLYVRLENEKKVLVILDNIWADFDLQAIGIPVGDGHKVLLTARSADVMHSQRSFSVEILDDEEAWWLFKTMSTDNIEGGELESVAREVSNKCAGVPVVIVTVARALKNKELFVWKDALQKMSIQNIHASLELSFNYLETEVLKTILLIGYANITSVDELLLYGMGLSVFVDINKMEERRVRALTLLQQLKDSYLLLDDNTTGEDFSMHDDIRDVAMSIASRDWHVFTKQQFSELKLPDENALKVYSSIVLEDVETGDLPPVLECQQLKLLSISGAYLNSHSLQIYDNFFTRMVELEVLVLDNMDLSSLPSSFCSLENLRALGLYNCKLGDVAIIEELKKLEILSLKNSNIEGLPVEVGHLTWLKSLDLRGCFGLHVIEPNVISSLFHLEELYMGSFFKWEEEGLNKDRKNASLDELKHLSNLTCLEIEIKDAKTLPKDLFFTKLERYKIEIGSSLNQDWIWDFKLPNSCRKFSLSLINTNICLKEGHIMQLKKIEDLRLDGSLDMENVLYGLDKDGFPQLKYLQVSNNDNVLCIVDSISHVTGNVFPVLESLLMKKLINMEKICCRQLTTESSFGLLKNIKVERCDKLENIFSFFIARKLQLLQSIDITFCKNIQEIFAIEKEDESSSNITEVIDNIKLSRLHSLKLIGLPQLKSFCSKLRTHSSSQQRQDEIILEDGINVSETLFTEKVALPNLEVLELYGINIERIWQNQIAAMASSIQNLTRLILNGCNNLRYLFSSSMIRSFDQLQYLEISDCQALEEIMVINNDKFREEERKNNVAFPNSNMNNYLKMKIWGCNKLKTLFHWNMYRKFLRLESLSVQNCGSLEVIFDLEGPNFEDKHSAQVINLSRLKIVGLPKLKHVWNKDTQKFVSFEKLNKVRIVGCGILKNVFPPSVASNLSQLEMLDISNCGVEEIVFVADGVETNFKFVFPRVISLTLEDLPKFTTLFPRLYTAEWPAIKKLKVKNLSLQESHKDGQLHFLHEKVFLNLEELIVEGNGVETIWQFPKEVFYKVKRLEVKLDESTVFSSLDFLQRFHSIKMLQILGGKSIDDESSYDEYESTDDKFESSYDEYESTDDDYEFTYDEDENEMSAVIINLNMCSNLKNVLKEEFNMDHLLSLQVSRCDNLVNLGPSSISFRNLTTLRVYNCKGMTNLMTYSAAKSLRKLRQMIIRRCNAIIELLAIDEGDEAKDDAIVFEELKELRLSHLESLTSFCSANYTFQFPSLEELTVKRCRKMKSFSGGEVITPKLQKVKHQVYQWGQWRNQEFWKGNLNTTIQVLHKEMFKRHVTRSRRSSIGSSGNVEFQLPKEDSRRLSI